MQLLLFILICLTKQKTDFNREYNGAAGTLTFTWKPKEAVKTCEKEEEATTTTTTTEGDGGVVVSVLQTFARLDVHVTVDADRWPMAVAAHPIPCLPDGWGILQECLTAHAVKRKDAGEKKEKEKEKEKPETTPEKEKAKSTPQRRRKGSRQKKQGDK